MKTGDPSPGNANRADVDMGRTKNARVADDNVDLPPPKLIKNAINRSSRKDIIAGAACDSVQLG